MGWVCSMWTILNGLHSFLLSLCIWCHSCHLSRICMVGYNLIELCIWTCIALACPLLSLREESKLFSVHQNSLVSFNSGRITLTLFSAVMLCFSVKAETVCCNAGWFILYSRHVSLHNVCLELFSVLSVGCAHYLSQTHIQWWDVMHTVPSESSVSLSRRTCSRCRRDWLDFITSVWTASSTWLYRHVTHSRESLHERKDTYKCVCSQRLQKPHTQRL